MADSNNASTMMVALIAILVIIVIGFVVLRVIPGAGDTNGSDINVDIPTPDINTVE